MSKYLIYLSCISLFVCGCEKEYFPDEEALRDANLYGTWVNVRDIDDDQPSLWVYTDEGYCGLTYCLNPKSEKGQRKYTNLDGIWYIKENQILAQGRFKSNKWKYNPFYTFENDTLILENPIKGNVYKMVKYKDDILYIGAGFVAVKK